MKKKIVKNITKMEKVKAAKERKKMYIEMV